MIRRRFGSDADQSWPDGGAASARRGAAPSPTSLVAAGPDQPWRDGGAASRWGSSPEPPGDDGSLIAEVPSWADLVGPRTASAGTELHDSTIVPQARTHRRAKRVRRAVELDAAIEAERSEGSPTAGRSAEERSRRAGTGAGGGSLRRSFASSADIGEADAIGASRWGSAPDIDGLASTVEARPGESRPGAAERRLRAHADRTVESPARRPVAARAPRGRRPPTKPSDPLGEVRIAQRRAEVLEAQRRTRKHRRVAMWGLIVLVSTAIAVVASPLAAVSRIEVAGATNTPTEQIRVAAATGSRSLVFVRGADVRRRVERLAWVARVRVRRSVVGRHPTLAVTVIERVAVAAVRIRDGRWVTVDATGRVLATAPVKPPELIGVSVERLAATPVSARILAARIAPVLRALTPIGALAVTEDPVATLASVFADAVPEAPDGPSAATAGIAALEPGRQVPITARRGILVARSLPAPRSARPSAGERSSAGSTSGGALVQVDGDRVRVLVPRPQGTNRATNANRRNRSVAFDFGAVDVPTVAEASIGRSGGDPNAGEAAVIGVRASTVERRVRAFEILLNELDLTKTLLVDLSVPDAPVVTPT